MKSSKLDKRLEAAASLVKFGAVLADVGSDHAYLPIYLCKNGRIKSAIASDINEGPVENARENIKANRLENRITAIRADGLKGLEKYSFDTVSICGMGGELIYEIINVPLVRERKPSLILQPMSSLPNLSYLMAKGGFSIDEDLFIKDGEKIYRVMCAFYSGESYNISPLEAYVGKINLQRRDGVTLEYIEKLRKTNEKIMLSKKSGGSDFSAEETLENEISHYLSGE